MENLSLQVLDCNPVAKTLTVSFAAEGPSAAVRKVLVFSLAEVADQPVQTVLKRIAASGVMLAATQAAREASLIDESLLPAYAALVGKEFIYSVADLPSIPLSKVL